MTVKYTYAKTEEIDGEVTDGLLPHSMLKLAIAMARREVPGDAMLEAVSWTTADGQFGGTL